VKCSNVQLAASGRASRKAQEQRQGEIRRDSPKTEETGQIITMPHPGEQSKEFIRFDGLLIEVF
jgi:hypothetical protein